MWDRRLSVAGHEAGDHGHAAEHILDGTNVEAGEGTAAGGVVKHGHPFLLHDAVGSEVDRLEGAEEGLGHFGMAQYVLQGASRAQSAPKQKLQDALALGESNTVLFPRRQYVSRGDCRL